MAKCGIITLTGYTDNVDNFDLLSDVDGYTTPFDTGVSRLDMIAGYTGYTIPDGTTIVKVISNTPACTNDIYITMSVPAPTPTPTVTSTVTPSVTPSGTPAITPSSTPAVTPSSTPAVTPSSTPAVTPSSSITTYSNITINGVGIVINYKIDAVTIGGMSIIHDSGKDFPIGDDETFYGHTTIYGTYDVVVTFSQPDNGASVKLTKNSIEIDCFIMDAVETEYTFSSVNINNEDIVIDYEYPNTC